ncbi:hypothetical protein CDAR_120211 [Caerostris darwini]|uniref:Uncharacterized protein n=1 Tax=Caerostris darwini TaxID=1538125 RepID=A0AAV4UPW3_9ARAC|nr:hypothetical protein CDAR_120211 [Caerostris darwini]
MGHPPHFSCISPSNFLLFCIVTYQQDRSVIVKDARMSLSHTSESAFKEEVLLKVLPPEKVLEKEAARISGFTSALSGIRTVLLTTRQGVGVEMSRGVRRTNEAWVRRCRKLPPLITPGQEGDFISRKKGNKRLRAGEGKAASVEHQHYSRLSKN